MRRYHLIIVLIVALLGGVAALAIARSPVLGLDLQGGLEVVLEADAPTGEEVNEEGLDRSIEIMRSRVDGLGVGETEFRKQGENQIVVQLPGVTDPARAAEVIGKTAQLQFYDLEADLLPPSIDAQGFPNASPTLYPLLKSQSDVAEQGTPSAWYLFAAPAEAVEGEEAPEPELLAGPEATQEEVLVQLPSGEAPEGSEFLAVPENMIVISCGPSARVCPDVGQSPPTSTFYYLFRHQPTDAERPIPEMTGDHLELDGTRQDFDPQTNEPIVVMQFTDEGEDRFHDITRELAIRGRLKTGQFASDVPILQHFAIVLDGEIQSFPTIDFELYPDGISGNNGAQISGLDSIDEAKDLALVLQTGALPYTFEQVDRTDISATLGEDSLREAVIAAIGGLVAVAAFLLLVYRFLGVIAIAGLLIYGGALYGAILIFGVVLTLPGFAGLVLTIGVAADANIVIFERIKEEVRAGRSVRAAIPAGYRKGFATIVDANVVTMITAFVLFAIAIASVKGFALMLLIGTLLSMLTAVAATRAMLGLLSSFRWFDNPAFMGAAGKKVPRWQRIDVNSPKRRRIWLSIATLLIVASIISISVKGLNLGIDFEGGSQVSFETAAPTSIERVRQVAATVIPANSVVQGRGEASGDNYSSFQIRTESLAQAEQDRLTSTLQRELDAEVSGIRTVSGSFSSQIARGSIIAIVVSFVLISIYISIRFQWRFAIPILRTLFNDILITLGVFSLSGREMTTATVAAVLTILGYSIYDTIIIFDRVRENMPLMRRSSFAAIANQSLWETIRRSMATTFVTLLPIGSLLFFGGDTLKDFAFALLVGIGLGAISTVFVATPFLTVLMERTPEYAPRRGQIDHEEKPLDAGPEPVPAPGAARLARLRRRAAGALPAGDGGRGRGAPAALAEPAEEKLEAEVEEPAEADEPVEAASPAARSTDAAARREARRKRRRSRPHGRAR